MTIETYMHNTGIYLRITYTNEIRQCLHPKNRNRKKEKKTPYILKASFRLFWAPLFLVFGIFPSHLYFYVFKCHNLTYNYNGNPY